ncbi:hypothetical protein [Pseudonocardia sp. TRM90224]|uniref:hypothetical protein n=1 Tax=Pseudonocardia sp. TRM90224 TaxID=2812678 RepID=UPI001E4FF63D|nr:hypothetical protein [Pseudonocardia sp. TRM90224]
MRHPAVPYLEPLLGGVWWMLGAAALDGGVGTVVLAAGLGVTVGLILALRKRHGAGSPLPRGGKRRMTQIVVVTVALIIAVGIGLGYLQQGELAVPVACGLVGLALFPVSSLLDERSVMAAGGVLLVLGAAGVLLALDSAGNFYPQGVVGLVAGGVLWLVAAFRGGLITEAQGRVRG